MRSPRLTSTTPRWTTRPPSSSPASGTSPSQTNPIRTATRETAGYTSDGDHSADHPRSGELLAEEQRRDRDADERGGATTMLAVPAGTFSSAALRST
jgi:hypothetical protein